MRKCLINLLLLVGCLVHGQVVPPEARELLAQQPFLTSSPDVISNPESLHILFNDTVYQHLNGNPSMGYRWNSGYVWSGIGEIRVTTAPGLEAYEEPVRKALWFTLKESGLAVQDGPDITHVCVVGVEPKAGPDTLPGLAVEVIASNRDRTAGLFLRMGTGSSQGLERAMLDAMVLVSAAIRETRVR